MPLEDSLEPFAACWDDLADPRSGNAGLHDFHELLMIALCAVLCGGQGAVDMARFAREKERFLRGFLRLANGPPSHDTFSRLFVSVCCRPRFWLSGAGVCWAMVSSSRGAGR